MKSGQVTSILATSILAIGITACGGGPDIDQVRKDFENPSGSVSSQDGVIAAQGKQEISGPALAIGAGVPGASLTANGKFVSLRELDVRRTWEPRLRTLGTQLRSGDTNIVRSSQTLDASCASSAEAEAAFEELSRDLAGDLVFGGGSAKGSASYSADLASCSNGRLTGKIKVSLEVEYELTESRTHIVYKIEQTLDNVCETSGSKACMDGGMIVEAEIDGSENAGSMKLLTAWDLSSSWDEGGARKEATLKGGLRFGFSGSGDMGSASFEFLAYVTAPDGTEYSYVLELNASSDGSGSLKIRGSDGELTCTFNADGSGECSGSATLAWTAEDAAGIDDSWIGG